MPVTRTERGWAGHFCCSDRCQFHRNTLLECGEERIVVSTVGAFAPYEKDYGTIGVNPNRYYETKAFKAVFSRYVIWDVNVGQRVSFDSPWSLGDKPNMADNKADAMHEAVVAELTARLEGGDHD